MPQSDDPFAKYGGTEILEGGDPFEKYGGTEIEGGPAKPIQEQHPDAGVGMRQLIMFSGGDPEVGARYLRQKGFEVERLEGFNYALKKPGERDWKVLDPEGFDWQDLLDISGDVLSLGGMVAGGIAGSPGVVTGAAGAAAGAAGAQGVRSTLGHMAGLRPTPGEAAKGIAGEAVMGAGAELGGRVLGSAVGKVAGRLRKKPYVPPKSGPPPKDAATRDEIIEAISKAPPEEQLKVGYSGQAGKPAHEVTVTKDVPLDQEVWDWALRSAAKVAGKGNFKGMDTQEAAHVIYTKMVRGKVPVSRRGELGPFVDVATREAQIARGGSAIELTEMVGTRTAKPAQPPTALLQLMQKTGPIGQGTYLHKHLQDHIAHILKMPIEIAHLEWERILKPAFAALRRDGEIPFDLAAKQWGQITKGFSSWFKSGRASVVESVMPAGFKFTPKVPIGQEVDFWRFLPIQGINKLTLENGRTLTLTSQQGKVVKAAIQATATGVWTSKLRKAFRALVAGLKWPRAIIVRAIEGATNRQVGRWMRRHPATTNVGLGIAEAGVGGLAGGIPGAAAVMDIAGRGINRVAQALFSDSTGAALKRLLGARKLGVPDSLKRAAQAATAGNDQLYKAIIWGALQKQDVQEYLQGAAGSSGINASGPRVQAGYQGG